MSLRQRLLRPAARLAVWQVQKHLREFLAAHQDPRRVQAELLREILAAHAETDFARDHGLEKVRTMADFRAAVPIQTYETLRPYMQRVLEGRTTALLPPSQRVLMFSMTSGTTGRPKYIPVTPRFLADVRRGWNVFGLNLLQQHPNAWLRPVVQISSSPHEQTSPSGLPCGAISGLLAETQKRIVRRMYVTPRWAAEVADPTARYYTILRFSIGRDVAFITTANPSSVVKLIETGQQYAEALLRDVRDGTFQPPDGPLPNRVSGIRFRPNRKLARRLEEGIARDGKLLPKHFWNLSFLAHWTGGTLKLYLRRVRELFDGVPIHDIGLLASEGRFTVPLRSETPAGVAEITSHVLEFIPAAERENDQPRTLGAEELEVGEEYFLVVTNWAGLFRYNLDDRVRVVERYAASPVLEFLSRGLHTANITGEKITEHQVVEAMRQARRATGANVERFVLQGRFAATPYYELRLEALRGGATEDLAQAVDMALCEMNVEYASKRKSRRLDPIRPVILPDGVLEQAERENLRHRHGRCEQYKHQYLLTEVLDESART